MKKWEKLFFEGAFLKKPRNWDEAWTVLIKAIGLQPKDKKIILFFDEIMWLVTHSSTFLQDVDVYWKEDWSKDKRIKLIICG